MHRIKTDVATGIIEVEIVGFWTVEDVAAFADELAGQARGIRLNGKRQVLLYDYTEAAIQSREVIAALQALVERDAFGSRKVAFYTAGRLARLQARRIAACGACIGVFEDRAAALQWLAAA